MRELLYKKYVTETFDENHTLTNIEFHVPETYNFAFDVVGELARLTPDAQALIYLDEEKKEQIFTFRDIDRLSNQAANYFLDRGITKGDKVLLILRRHYQYWIVMMALCKIGAVAIPATDQLMAKDIEYRVNVGDVKAIIATAKGHVPSAVMEGIANTHTVKLLMSVREKVEGFEFFDELVKTYPDTLSREDVGYALHKDDDMLMYFTSGTTSYPKVAIHSQMYSIGHIVTGRHWHTCRRGEIHFTISDTGWGKAAWGKLYGQWFCESVVFVYDFERFHANDILELFGKYKIATFCAPPTMFRFFIHEDLAKYDLSSLRHVATAGEAVNPQVFNEFKRHTGLMMMEGFGQTETTLTVANLEGSTPKPGSMGKANPQYKIDLLTPEGKSCAPGQTGELVVDTREGTPPGMFKGYYKDEEKTSGAWHDGYYHTGDVAWRDEDGYFFFVGRIDDLIKSSGYRISPFEVESVLMEHDAVLECAVTGAPDEVRGQVVKATIVLTKQYTPSEALQKEIQTFVKERTAPYKYPRIIEFVEELPKTISGKIRRSEIRKTKD